MLLLATVSCIILGIALVNCSIQEMHSMPTGYVPTQDRPRNTKPKLFMAAGILAMLAGTVLMILGGIL